MSVTFNKEIEDLTGKVFNRWTVISYAGFEKRHLWNVECKCGEKRIVRAYQLTGNVSKSCGCLAKDVNRERRTVHGECRGGKPSPEFRAYLLARAQCQNPNHENYAKFGGKGIQFLFVDFAEFLTTVGRKPDRKAVLSRKDPAGNYEAGNIIWTTNKNRQKR